MRSYWSYDPIRAIAVARLGVPRPNEPAAESGATINNIAELLGAHPRQVWEWSKRGTLTDLWADRAAIHLGLHPALVWADWYSRELIGADQPLVSPCRRRSGVVTATLWFIAGWVAGLVALLAVWELLRRIGPQ